MKRNGTRVLQFSLLLSVAALLLHPLGAEAFNQPAYNLGLTNCLDGAVPGPGLYLIAYTQYYGAKDVEVNNLVPQPLKNILENTDVNSLAAVFQIAYVTKKKLFDGFLAWNTVIPLVDISTDGPINDFVGGQIENTGGVGDIITGPFIQWVGKTLFGRPYFHRIEFQVIVPSGHHSDRFLLNPGANIVTFNPYYSFTWLPLDKLDVSFRIHYAWNSRNQSPYKTLYGSDATLKPGQAFHFNYTVEYNVYKKFWMGMAGYCMWQLNKDDLDNSVLPPQLAESLLQREQVIGIGPIVTLQPIPNLILSWATAFEVAVKNRPDGIKGTFKILYKFW